MRQQQFEAENQSLWDEIAALMDDLGRAQGKRHSSLSEQLRFPALYRQLCSHYALARGRGFSPALIEQLHGQVLRGHSLLYRQQGGWRWRILGFIYSGFPSAVRRSGGYFAIALLFFLLPAVVMGVGCYLQEDLIYTLIDETTVAQVESSYDPTNQRLGRALERSSETDFTMFGYYIMNNIGIGFRAFASGIIFAVGTLFILLFNGLVIGGLAGHLSQLGYHDTFWPFVSGHGSFELTAIVICGAAGLRLGHAVIAPGQRTRVQALQEQAQEALQLVLGAALMLLVAAFIEAFWSSMQIQPATKYVVAAILWTTVIAYLLLVGRGRRGPH
ncbi:stage II sporulation protein M [Candidatus Thiodiazotropha sp. CDECU1]|uniref:stage II sporulation protein M n=1 Tax=Candidatus Thiodiazotropha sp. CDECU1 TaxID=3065865 RepID=UPI00292CB78B|nr:stage II sporulation protein M [Candidatus Thiodiazotropha sp. CDECU1]